MSVVHSPVWHPNFSAVNAYRTNFSLLETPFAVFCFFEESDGFFFSIVSACVRDLCSISPFAIIGNVQLGISCGIQGSYGFWCSKSTNQRLAVFK